MSVANAVKQKVALCCSDFSDQIKAAMLGKKTIHNGNVKRRLKIVL